MGPPPLPIKCCPFELILREEISNSEHLARLFGRAQARERIACAPFGAATRDVRVGTRRVNLCETAGGVVKTEHDLRRTNGVTNSVEQIGPEACIKRGVVDRCNKVQHLVLAGKFSA